MGANEKLGIEIVIDKVTTAPNLAGDISAEVQKLGKNVKPVNVPVTAGDLSGVTKQLEGLVKLLSEAFGGKTTDNAQKVTARIEAMAKAFGITTEQAKALVAAIENSAKDILIVASSDMSHYEPRKIAEKQDRLALQCIEQFNPYDLYHTVIDHRISMCGVIPVVIAMLAAKIQGGDKFHLIGYTDSGYMSGDIEQVVGYAGIILS